ncbi:hypothetical protein VTL71DRAFT_3507 [Oculimacula yallundae]|uniref:F-box domain-containing protein n=1 Tax=Oculimacula yallundae TaxID=86028 RepID=A0ABR4C8J0_9HELO
MSISATMNVIEDHNSLREESSPLVVTTPMESPGPNTSDLMSSREPLHLPPEIIDIILSYIPLRPASQSTLRTCTLINRSFYYASTPLLYHRPYITPSNFSLFVRTICPSKNAHVKHTPLSPLVHRLDMGALVHNSSKSLTARLLGRLKGNIEQFVAPQASFAVNSFAALGKCKRMKLLDLSLISASISNSVLFQTLSHLDDLETLYFPRSSALDQLSVSANTIPYIWPPKLSALHLAGGITDSFLWTHMISLPSTLRTLSIQHCSQIHQHSVIHVLETLGERLTHLTIRHPMNHLSITSLDSLLLLCPSLLALRISADFISPSLFAAENIPLTIPPPTSSNPNPSPIQAHPLRILDLECSPSASSDVDIPPHILYQAAEEGLLPDLRSVRVSMRLAWGATEKTRRDAADLLEVMEEREMERPVGVGAEVLWSMGDT